MPEERHTEQLHILMTPTASKRVALMAWRRRITISALVRRLIEDAWLADKRKKKTDEPLDEFFNR